MRYFEDVCPGHTETIAGIASLPFPFDVHAMIYVDDALAMEAALHCEFGDFRDLRNEFFRTDLASIKEAVDKTADTAADFKITVSAEKYKAGVKVITKDDAVKIISVNSYDIADALDEKEVPQIVTAWIKVYAPVY